MGAISRLRSARIWKWVVHRQFRHGRTQIPAAKPRCIAAACFAPSLGPQQSAVFVLPAQSISGLSGTEGCEGQFVSANTHTRRGNLQDPPLLPEPEEISPNTWDPAGRDGDPGTAEPMSSLKPCPADHQPSPRFTYSSQILPNSMAVASAQAH